MYYLNGVVYGNYWGGGKGCYKAASQCFQEKKDLDNFLTKVQEMKDLGSLDGGMGYEKVIAVSYNITHKFTEDNSERYNPLGLCMNEYKYTIKK